MGFKKLKHLFICFKDSGHGMAGEGKKKAQEAQHGEREEEHYRKKKIAVTL